MDTDNGSINISKNIDNDNNNGHKKRIISTERTRKLGI